MSEVPTGKAKRRVVSFGGENKKPPKPEGPPPSHAVRAKKTLNPVRKQPRPAASPGMPAEDPDDEPEPIKTTVNEEKDKNSAMSQIGSAIGNLWNWAKQKGSKLRTQKDVNMPSGEAPPVPYKALVKKFKKMLLEDEKIDEGFVRSHAFRFGAPEGSGYRSILWKLILGYLPYNRNQWKKILLMKRKLYGDWVLELVTNPYKEMFEHQNNPKSNPELKLSAVGEGEDPLTSIAQVPNSKWQQFFKDEELRDEIHKDVMRTYSSFSFFMQKVGITEASGPESQPSPKLAKQNKSNPNPNPNPNPNSNPNPKPNPIPKPTPNPASQTPGTKVDSSKAPPENKSGGEQKKIRKLMPSADETHHDVIQRILFIYAKLNPGVRYVQGMNEILAPIYFTFAKDTDIEFRRGAETDAFFCFANLMTEIRDRFIRSLDCTSAGIIAAVKDLNDLLAKVDRKLHAHLRKLNIDPRFYAFRWLTLLLSQEFELPDTIRLWDSLFADSHRFQHLTYCCCAMLLLYRATHLRDRTKFEVSVANGQQLVMPIDLDKHLGIEVRRRSRN
ncbi:hypothetical protein AAMO2058_001100800 [Amorphochlora amoebiformis]